MRNLLNSFLRKFGFTFYSKKLFNYYSNAELQKLYNVDELDLGFVKGKLGIGLREKLLRENKTRWLDVGCGGNFEENFYYLDTFPEGIVAEKEKYFRANIVSMTENDFARVGTYDLVRLQHVFEHVTPEDGVNVLNNCARLLNKDGYILITTPDLRKYINLYLTGKIKENFDWALNRIEKDSPDSFYFSVFSHSMPHEKHEWCYDAQGLIYQFERTGKFKNITELTLDHELANVPFTHNRPEVEVCVMAQVK